MVIGKTLTNQQRIFFHALNDIIIMNIHLTLQALLFKDKTS